MENNDIVIEKPKRKFLKILILTIVLLTILACFILYYARYIGTKGLVIKEYGVKTNIQEINGFKIAHISDIHYGKTTNKTDLCKLVDKINLTKPDILVMTGDLLDKDYSVTVSDISDINECLLKINVSMSKYVISGEDDYTDDAFYSIIKTSEFIDLNDSYDMIYLDSKNYIFISGISSKYNNKTAAEKNILANTFLKDNPNPPKYKILLVHEIDIINELQIDDYNLILAGHNHGGQINIPFFSKTLNYKINNTSIFISSGIGTSDYSFRLFNKPSFNFYRVMKK